MIFGALNKDNRLVQISFLQAKEAIAYLVICTNYCWITLNYSNRDLVVQSQVKWCVWIVSARSHLQFLFEMVWVDVLDLFIIGRM